MYHWAGMQSPRYPGPPEMWPKALSFLGNMRDPDAIGEPRHYLFHVIWGRPCSTTFLHDDDIRLDREKPEPAGTFRFRVFETVELPERLLRKDGAPY